MGIRSRLWLEACLRGLAQVALLESRLAGGLILVAIACVAPFSALGAAIGAILATALARPLKLFTTDEWRAGFAGYNPAIVGIMWGGVLARGDWTALGLIPAILVCMGLDSLARRFLVRRGLPPFGLAATLVGWASAWLFHLLGDSFWHHPGLVPLGEAGVFAGVAIVTALLARRAAGAALWTLLTTAAAALLSGWAYGHEIVGPAALWAFAVAPAAFAPAGAVFRGTRGGQMMSLAAPLLAAAIWIAWTASGLSLYLPPLLMPAILGLWLAMLPLVLKGGPLILEPNVVAAAGVLSRAEKPAAALTGAGISTASDIPDYVSGAWFDRRTPVAEYGFDRFLASADARRKYWDACRRFRDIAGNARPNAGHRALARMERGGVLAEVVTQNVDGLHQAGGARAVVELHGNIGQVHCLICDAAFDWPDPEAWQDGDAECPDCGGLLKPAVIAMGENIPPQTWKAACEAVGNSGALIVIGTQLAVSSAAALLDQARARDIPVIFVTMGTIYQPVLAADIVCHLPAEEALPAIASLASWGLRAAIARPTAAADQPVVGKSSVSPSA